MANTLLRSAKWAPGTIVKTEESSEGARKWRVSSAAIVQLFIQAK